MGRDYFHLRVSAKDMKPEQVDEFRRRLVALPEPVFAHCRRGKRAFVMMGMALDQGLSGDQTLRQAEPMGFRCDQPELKEFVKGYVDRNRK